MVVTAVLKSLSFLSFLFHRKDLLQAEICVYHQTEGFLFSYFHFLITSIFLTMQKVLFQRLDSFCGYRGFPMTFFPGFSVYSSDDMQANIRVNFFFKCKRIRNNIMSQIFQFSIMTSINIFEKCVYVGCSFVE